MTDEATESDMQFKTLLLEHDGPLTWIVLNRPESLNALSTMLLRELETALDHLAERRATRVIAIRGAGRAFCVGYDIESDGEEIGESAHRGLAADRRRLERNLETFMRIWRHPKPVIAAVHGYCIAGGSQLATMCDMTVIADDAKIGIPSIPVGGGYISPMWVPLVGAKRAKQMTFQAGTYISGETASQWGWANYSVPADEVIENVTALARNIALTPADVLEVKKAAVNRAADVMGWSTIMPLGAETDALLHHTDTVKFMADQIMQQGLKQTVKSFKAGEYQEELDRLS
ncbi:crotonase/enoyl-CoA hydratase family protein [soil metagenome]